MFLTRIAGVMPLGRLRQGILCDFQGKPLEMPVEKGGNRPRWGWYQSTSVRPRSLSIPMSRAQEYYAQDPEWARQVLFSSATERI